MRRFAAVFLAALLFLAVSMSARAVIVSYAVDVGGGGFGPLFPFVTPLAQSTLGQSALGYVPFAGVLNVPQSEIDLDIASVFLGTNQAITAPADSITDTRNYTIRIVLGPNFLDPTAPFIDLTQTTTISETDVRQGSSVGHLLFLSGPTPADFMLDGIPFHVAFKSFDFPGAPQDVGGLGVTGLTYEGAGGKTDMISSVPEPGSLGMLLGSGFAGSLFFIRRRRRA